ncbi:MAG: ABC transporter substrate-binding protein, partial [Deltaproteobacteria bacterium]
MLTAGVTASLVLTAGAYTASSASTHKINRPAKSIHAHGAATTYLQLANDKSDWTTEFNALGKILASKDGVGWQAEPYPSTTAFQAVVRTAATTSKAPALFTWWSGQQLLPLVQQGALANMTSEVKKWEANYGLNPDVEKAYEVNGQYYGAPLYTANWIMYYNKADYAKYHLSVPTTWTQLMHNAAVLKAAGISPFAYYVSDWAGFIWFEQLLVEQNPAAYEALVRGKISYTSPPVVAAMKEWKKIADLGYFATPQNIDTQLGTPIDFKNGSNAMLLIGSWDETTLTQAGMVPGKSFGAFVVPPLNPKVGWQAIFETGPVVVSAHNPAQGQAMKSVNTFMEPAIQGKWDKLQHFVSAESKVPMTDPTAKAVASEIKTEKVTLHNRYWEATPPQIAV